MMTGILALATNLDYFTKRSRITQHLSFNAGYLKWTNLNNKNNSMEQRSDVKKHGFDLLSSYFTGVSVYATNNQTIKMT